MKTARYTIEFEGYEVDMCKTMEITKKEFNRQLDFMRQQVRTTPETNEYPVSEAEPITKEYAGHTTTVYIFHSGTVTTYLTAMICKDGYQFKSNKKE